MKHLENKMKKEKKTAKYNGKFIKMYKLQRVAIQLNSNRWFGSVTDSSNPFGKVAWPECGEWRIFMQIEATLSCLHSVGFVIVYLDPLAWEVLLVYAGQHTHTHTQAVQFQAIDLVFELIPIRN